MVRNTLGFFTGNDSSVLSRVIADNVTGQVL
jgi:hypothetical protein